MVNQIPLFFYTSLEDNITIFGKYNNEIWHRLKQEEYLRDLFSRKIYGISTTLNERRIELSLGQQKIISLCRIILQNPSIVILAEYFSNLDNNAKYLSNKTDK
jgi:ABC-type multidrug transport system fused ATPase/permease subunit